MICWCLLLVAAGCLGVSELEGRTGDRLVGRRWRLGSWKIEESLREKGGGRGLTAHRGTSVTFWARMRRAKRVRKMKVLRYRIILAGREKSRNYSVVADYSW